MAAVHQTATGRVCRQVVNFVTYAAVRLRARVASSYIASRRSANHAAAMQHALFVDHHRRRRRRRRPTNVGKLNADAQKCFSCNQSNFYCSAAAAAAAAAATDFNSSRRKRRRRRRYRADWSIVERRAIIQHPAAAARLPLSATICHRGAGTRHRGPVERRSERAEQRHIRSVTQDETWYTTGLRAAAALYDLSTFVSVVVGQR